MPIERNLMLKRIRREEKLKYILPLLSLAVVVTGAAITTNFNRLEPLVERSTFLQHFLPTWHAFKKSSDFIHIANWAQSTSIPVYDLAIEPSAIEQLIEQLPFDRDSAKFLPVTSGVQSSTKARFISSTDEYGAEIKISFLGASADSWSSEKKAFRIKFPKENLFNGASELDLILPDSSLYFIEPLNSYRAKKLGLLPNEYKFVRIKINERDFGVYLAREPWSSEFISRQGNLYDTDNILTAKNDSTQDSHGIFSENGKSQWQSLSTKKNAGGPFEELNTLIDITTKTSDDEFAQKIPAILDLDKFYKWQLLTVLAGSKEANDFGNIIMVFKKETGKFEILPSDIKIFPIDNFLDIYNSENLLARRILSNKKFFYEYKKIAAAYVNDPQNLQDDLKFYDDLQTTYTGEFYADPVKKDNDYDFTKKTLTYNNYVIQNFNKLKEAINEQTELKIVAPVTKPAPILYAGSFASFNNQSETIEQFVSTNKQFHKSGAKNLVLETGTHVFEQTVIVPSGLTLTIQPGTRLLLGPHASFVSYSQVFAVGAPDAMIYVGPSIPKSEVPWGSFAAMNAEGSRNVFRYIHVEGGGSDIINGIPLPSQFTLHNTHTEVTDSLFENSKSDDAFHATAGTVSVVGCTFKNSLADGIDFEHVHDSLIENNIFINENTETSSGDAIDLATTVNLEILNNKIINFADKGVSIGEHSSNIHVNTIFVINSGTGIASKEESDVTIKNGTFLHNKIGFAAYRQKQEYNNGGTIIAENVTLWDNKTQLETDKYSIQTIKNSTIQGGAIGENISSEKPDLTLLVPHDVLAFINLSSL